jgi:hypothetical protein
MPIYEYECPIHGIFERILPVSMREYSSTCRLNEECLEDCKKLVSLPANTKTPEDSKSNFTYYENKKGQIEFTGTPNQWHPEGFVRKTARNLYERLAIEKRIRKQDNERLEQQREKRDIQRHYSTAERHSELRQRLREGQMLITNPETGNKENVVLDERSRTIMKKGMEYTNKKKVKRIDSEFHFSTNHDNKSNVRGNE